MLNFEDIVNEFSKIRVMDKEQRQDIIKKIREQAVEKIKKDKIKALVVGVSGGLDSAVVCALLQEKYTGIELIGVSIPMNNTFDHREKANWVGANYCTRFKEFQGWEDKYNEIFKVLDSTAEFTTDKADEINIFDKKVLLGNMKARIRMMTLYHIAREKNGIVLSTDNLSELNMGFWTLHGDVGDYGVIQNIEKGFELSQIAEELGVRQDIIDQAPSDGLMVTNENTDEAQLGASYKEVDTIMYCHQLIMNNGFKKAQKIFPFIDDFVRIFNGNRESKIAKIIKRHTDTEFKRVGTINITRKDLGLE